MPTRAARQLFDQIGAGYSAQRRADPRLAAPLTAALGPGVVLNVGAGTGSYEPRDRQVVAVEPSAVMIAQRPAGAAPVVQAAAEALPFRTRSFDVVMAVFTVHHWTDQSTGFGELRRVARRRVVFTFDPAVVNRMWLVEYWPEIAMLDFVRASSIAEVFAGIEGRAVTVVPVPHDCQDGMTTAYWRRPWAYLDPQVWVGSSAFRQLTPPALQRGCGRLAADLRGGRWHERYGHLLQLEELDCGLRLIVGEAV